MERPQGRAQSDESYRSAGPRRPTVLTTVLSAAGFGISVYDLVRHFTPMGPVLCGGTASIMDCLLITLDFRSTIFGVPIALLSSIFFLLLFTLGIMAAWQATNPWIIGARLIVATGGIGALLYLIAVEPWSLVEHSLVIISTGAVDFALFAVIAFATRPYRSEARVSGHLIRPASI
jgi:uncharacterized membrane protein